MVQPEWGVRWQAGLGSGQIGKQRQQKCLCGKAVAGAPFKQAGGTVQRGQLPAVAMRVCRGVFRLPKGKRRQTGIKALRQIGVNCDGHSQCRIAAPLKGVGLTGAQQD